MEKFLAVLMLLTLTACNMPWTAGPDEIAGIRTVACYSGGVLIYREITNRKIEHNTSGDWVVSNMKTGKKDQLTATCVAR